MRDGQDARASASWPGRPYLFRAAPRCISPKHSATRLTFTLQPPGQQQPQTRLSCHSTGPHAAQTPRKGSRAAPASQPPRLTEMSPLAAGMKLRQPCAMKQASSRRTAVVVRAERNARGPALAAVAASAALLLNVSSASADLNVYEAAAGAGPRGPSSGSASATDAVPPPGLGLALLLAPHSNPKPSNNLRWRVWQRLGSAVRRGGHSGPGLQRARPPPQVRLPSNC
jgi:hypothetical protein